MNTLHYVRCKAQYDHVTQANIPVWACVSLWSIQPEGRRIRTEMSRCTHYYDVRQARRWAKKYNVECPETIGTQNPLEPKINSK